MKKIPLWTLLLLMASCLPCLAQSESQIKSKAFYKFSPNTTIQSTSVGNKYITKIEWYIKDRTKLGTQVIIRYYMKAKDIAAACTGGDKGATYLNKFIAKGWDTYRMDVTTVMTPGSFETTPLGAVFFIIREDGGKTSYYGGQGPVFRAVRILKKIAENQLPITCDEFGNWYDTVKQYDDTSPIR
jgi:hypothetical protein